MSIELNNSIFMQIVHQKKPISPYLPYFSMNSYEEAVNNDFIKII